MDETIAAAGGTNLANEVGMGMGGLFILALLALLLAAKAGRTGFCLWLGATYPAATQRIAEAYETRGRRCVIVGLCNLLGGLLLAALLFATEILGLAGIFILLALLVLILHGYAAAYLNLGRRLTLDNQSFSNSRTMLLGGLAGEAAFLFPILGTLLEIGIGLRGLGAAALILWTRRKHKAPPITQAPIPPETQEPSQP